MSAQERAKWDAQYHQKTGDYPAPDPLLLMYTPPLSPKQKMRALDVACGVGQNGLWLAEQGYTVDMMDISRVALRRAQDEINKRQLRNTNLLQVDLDDTDFDDQLYDVVCVFRYLNRELFRKLRASVVNGGRIIYETFNTKHHTDNPTFNPAYLLEIAELPLYFKGWQILHECDDENMSQLVAVKPLDGVDPSVEGTFDF
ncbi:MAG: class I SAM-dependent methyltransferase [bacterium]|nr:class I SAM-dependent methyltransferase [bacterium]